LLATLQAALASLDRGSTISAVNQLGAFQNQVLAQVAPVAPGLAQQLWQSAQAVIDTLPRAPHRPYFTTVAKRAGGRVKVKFAGSPGQTCLIQATTNLVNWVTLGAATQLGNGMFEFEDARSDKLPARFYRVISPQPSATHYTGAGAK
jgi:hypothetical protein